MIHDSVTDTDGKTRSNILHLQHKHEKLTKSKYYSKWNASVKHNSIQKNITVKSRLFRCTLNQHQTFIRIATGSYTK